VLAEQDDRFGLFQTPDPAPMIAHQRAQRQGAQDVRFSRPPAQEAGRCDEGHLLRQKTGLLLQSPRDQDAVVGRQEIVARHHVGPSIMVRTDLATQVQRTEATGRRERLVPIRLHAAGGLRRPVPGGGLRIHRVPLQLTQPSQQALSRRGHLRLYHVQRGCRLARAHGGQINAGEFGHLLVFILNPANHTTQVAHGRLLEQCTRSLDLHPTASPAHDENGGTPALLRA